MCVFGGKKNVCSEIKKKKKKIRIILFQSDTERKVIRE